MIFYLPNQVLDDTRPPNKSRKIGSSKRSSEDVFDAAPSQDMSIAALSAPSRDMSIAALSAPRKKGTVRKIV